MLTLQRPALALLPSYLDAIAEMRDAGETIWPGYLPHPHETPERFIERLLRAETAPEPGLVAASSYWAVREEVVVGRIALRHHLTDALREFGGHIGYEVRPSCRRRGEARDMLRLLLATPKAHEIGRLLVTCAPDNVGSIKTILANGGVHERTAYVEKWQRDTSYYWIDVR